ncbi:DUF3789 domain-containing protein [Ruminococcus sp. zg-924]|nr:DUF3789 domain-containing protein [Ruminococcus sp. zg-924]MCQ4022791.1 DUF3789 domain-containing protein [Ruminococcus sp. zg-924]
MIGFIIGLFVGAFLGVLIMCLCNVASRADEEMNKIEIGKKKGGNE